MNLYTTAGGLFGTHVTWSDIEEDMQRELDTNASFGPNKSAKDIGEGSAAHFGCAGTDFVRLFVTCLSGKHRRAHWEELLEVFYGYLLEELGGSKVPYTLEQLKESYRRFFPIGGFIALTLMGTLFESLFKNSDEGLRKKCLETVCEKIDFVLYDIFYYHDRNTRIQKGEQVA
ncbi:hypothetical protein V3C99_001042 [Haemonchus contortus]